MGVWLVRKNSRRSETPRNFGGGPLIRASLSWSLRLWTTPPAAGPRQVISHAVRYASLVPGVAAPAGRRLRCAHAQCRSDDRADDPLGTRLCGEQAAAEPGAAG